MNISKQHKKEFETALSEYRDACAGGTTLSQVEAALHAYGLASTKKEKIAVRKVWKLAQKRSAK